MLLGFDMLPPLKSSTALPPLSDLPPRFTITGPVLGVTTKVLLPLSVRLLMLYLPPLTFSVVPPLMLKFPYCPGDRVTFLLPLLLQPLIDPQEPEMFWVLVGGAGFGAGGNG